MKLSSKENEILKKKHGRSHSQTDYNDLLKIGINPNPNSIYELVNKNDQTQNTRLNTIENCVITIPTMGNEEEIKMKGINELMNYFFVIKLVKFKILNQLTNFSKKSSYSKKILKKKF